MNEAKRRVLILEDDLQLADQWAGYISTFNFSCDIAFNRHEAETLCVERRYDAIVVDLFLKDEMGRLSGDGGLTFITHLRIPTLAGTPKWGEDVPIITVSGSSGVVSGLGHARNAGSDRTFPKPVEPETILDALVELLDAKVGT